MVCMVPYVCYLAKYINMRYVDMRLIEKANATTCIWHAFKHAAGTDVCHHAVLKYYLTFRIYRDM